MARFYASIQGSRGEATRMGTASSGIQGHIRGWDIGANVTLEEDADRDIVRIWLTRGSNGGPSIYLGAFALVDGELKRLRDMGFAGEASELHKLEPDPA